MDLSREQKIELIHELWHIMESFVDRAFRIHPEQVTEDHDLQSQETRCREYAKHKDYQVIDVFMDEGITGKLLDRPNIQKMLVFLKTHKKENLVVIIDDISRLVEHLLASVAAHQREKNTEQVKNRMRARVLNGYWVFHAPAGYRYGNKPAFPNKNKKGEVHFKSVNDMQKPAILAFRPDSRW